LIFFHLFNALWKLFILYLYYVNIFWLTFYAGRYVISSHRDYFLINWQTVRLFRTSVLRNWIIIKRFFGTMQARVGALSAHFSPGRRSKYSFRPRERLFYSLFRAAWHRAQNQGFHFLPPCHSDARQALFYFLIKPAATLLSTRCS
jgi:hypothetical protein